MDIDSGCIANGNERDKTHCPTNCSSSWKVHGIVIDFVPISIEATVNMS